MTRMMTQVSGGRANRARSALVAVGRDFHARGWSLGTSSNYSVVLDRDPLRLLITASGKHKERLSPDDFVHVAAEWGSDHDYDQRGANIRKGSGRNNERLNGEHYLVGRERNAFTTVFNDFGRIDELMGEGGQDWFFVSEGVGDDDIHDR